MSVGYVKNVNKKYEIAVTLILEIPLILIAVRSNTFVWLPIQNLVNLVRSFEWI